ncbi:MAG TPA: metallophosphoesterase, partial [Candidatus Limnocylindria bacterium]|nr:metallophosphoesterase [Candidatus Limnocylindria bacterium]
IVAGDLVDDDEDAAEVGAALRRALEPLRALYTTGNHETADERSPRLPFRRNDTRRTIAGLDAGGLERIDGRAVDLAGTTLIGIGWAGWAPGAPAAAIALVAAKRPAVVVTHSPDHVRGIAEAHALVALCGHTHGGQVRLPAVGAPWTPVRAPLPRLAGRMRLDGIPTYVSRGIGHTVPVRLGAVPEATLVEIAPDRRSRPPAGVRVVEL